MIRVFILLVFICFDTLASDPILLTKMFNLKKVDEVTLHRLAGWSNDPPNFHGFAFKSTDIVTDSALITDLLSELQYQLNHRKDGASMCFNPRHVISIETDDASFDFLICFECHKIKIYKDHAYIDEISIKNVSEGRVNQLFNLASQKIEI